MNPDHDVMRDLVLAYEELSSGERRDADAHLAICPDCAALLDRVQHIEREARPRGTLSSLEPTGALALSQAERAQAEASLAALRSRLGLERGAAPRRAPAPRPAWAGLLDAFRDRVLGPGVPRWALATVPIAAVLLVALIAVWPRPHGTTPQAPATEALLTDARILPYSGTRGGAPIGWHTGQAFVLDFNLASAARPIVFHVDPEGRVTPLYPESSASLPPLAPPGNVRLPPPGSGIEWRFEGEPGPETFLLTAVARDGVAWPALVEEASRSSGPDRSAALASLRALLEQRVGPVQVIEVTHLP